MSDLQTGIQALDRQLGGGFASGNLVALVTPPDAPSTRVLHQLMRQRSTTYLTTLRPGVDVETELVRLGNGTADVSIEEIGELKKTNKMLHNLTDSAIYSANTTDRERVLDEVNEIIDTIDGSQNVIVDPMNPLETSESKTAYQRLLRKMSAKLREENGLGILHCISSDEPPALRDRTLTMVDTVWNLEIGSDNEGNLELKTTIPKNRGGEVIFEKHTLILDRKTVRTDISRSI